MRKSLSVLVAIILFLIVGYLLFSGGVNLLDFSTGLALLLAGSAITVLWWGFKPEIMRWLKKKPTPDAVAISSSLDHSLRHVEARLFYPVDVRWNKKQRDPKKNNPRLKLVLIKDLKEAYYVGTYAWTLIIEGKIGWFSDDEQDIEEWCRKEGYKLIKQDATRDDLLKPYFEAKIRDKKTVYHQREPILFRTHYRGELVNGFFDNEIVFPNRTQSAWSWAPDTLDNEHPATKGNLDGYVNYSSNWSWVIPQNAPVGHYKVFMRVYNHLGLGSRPIIAQLDDVVIINQVEHSDALLNNKLIEVYSPIHAMIFRINKEIPRQSALQLTLGAWVTASLIDFDNISAVFNKHVHELGDDNLKMWLEIEKEIKEKNGFYLGKKRQKWFDELEEEYNRLKRRNE